jgi:hypothetical protein
VFKKKNTTEREGETLNIQVLILTVTGFSGICLPEIFRSALPHKDRNTLN